MPSWWPEIHCYQIGRDIRRLAVQRLIGIGWNRALNHRITLMKLQLPTTDQPASHAAQSTPDIPYNAHAEQPVQEITTQVALI